MTSLLNITMWRLVYFIVALCLAEVYTADDFQECMKLLNSEARKSTCCKQKPIKKELTDVDSKKFDSEKHYDKYEECKDLSDDGTECSEKSVCIAKKSGTMKENGDIDKEAVKSMMQDKMEHVILTEVYHKMVECVDKDLSKFETDTSCYFEKVGNCIAFHYVMGCVEWSDEQSCSEMKNTVDECAKMLSE